MIPPEMWLKNSGLEMEDKLAESRRARSFSGNQEVKTVMVNASGKDDKMFISILSGSSTTNCDKLLRFPVIERKGLFKSAVAVCYRTVVTIA